MTTKKTKKDYFNELRALVADNTELTSFIDHELELLTKRRTNTAQKPTKTQLANLDLAAAILDGMEPDTQYTISDLIKTIPALAELSNQKVSALVRTLVADQSITRTEDKRKAYFTINN